MRPRASALARRPANHPACGPVCVARALNPAISASARVRASGLKADQFANAECRIDFPPAAARRTEAGKNITWKNRRSTSRICRAAHGFVAQWHKGFETLFLQRLGAQTIGFKLRHIPANLILINCPINALPPRLFSLALANRQSLFPADYTQPVCA